MQLTVSSDWASTRHFRGSHCLAHCSGAPSEGLARCILHLSNPPCSRTRIGRQWAADTDRLPLARTQFHTLFLGSLFHGKQMDRRKERRSGRHTTARTREMERERGEESKSSRKRDTKRKKAHAPAQEEGRARARERESTRARACLCIRVRASERPFKQMHDPSGSQSYDRSASGSPSRNARSNVPFPEHGVSTEPRQGMEQS